jgi:hypothetical protein
MRRCLTARGALAPRALLLALGLTLAATSAHAFTAAAADALQRRRTPTRKPAPIPLTTEPATVTCAELLGTGVRTNATYCFILAGRDPVEGVIVSVPPHRGEATLTFDLHNRHTYSEEEMRAGRNFAKYSAVVGVLTMKGELLERGAVQTEFRTARDLFERIAGGAGPGGVKAVAPLGREQVIVRLPEGVDQISLLGELFEGVTAAGRETAAPGRPVALVSNVNVEYRPSPAKPKGRK